VRLRVADALTAARQQYALHCGLHFQGERYSDRSADAGSTRAARAAGMSIAAAATTR
jgi:hypothetical protein